MLYKAYGLIFKSELELPALIPVPDDTQHDVSIHLGKVPDKLNSDDVKNGVLYQITHDEFRLVLPNVAKYYVYAGKKIIIEPEKDADQSSILLFLLGSTMGALLHQRKLLPIHASGISTPKGAVLFLGQSGAGKSTTAAAFRQRGYPLLADDISVIRLNQEEKITVIPEYPQQKLWADTLDILNDTDSEYSKVRPQIQKFAVPVREKFSEDEIPLFKMYVLLKNTENTVNVEPITGLNKLFVTTASMYRSQFFHQSQPKDQHVKFNMILSKQVKIAKIKRLIDRHTIDDFLDVIEQDFLND